MHKRSKTSANSRQLNLEDSWMSSLVVSPANLFQLPVSDVERKTNDTSGRKCSGSLKRATQNGLWQKTFLELLLLKEGWYSNRYALNWKIVTTKFNRSLFQLQASVRRTYETGSGSLGIPVKHRKKTGKKKPDHCLPPVRELDAIIAAIHQHLTLPTPTARDWKGARSRIALMKAGRSATNSLPDFFSATTGLVLPLNPHFVAQVMGFPQTWTEFPFRNGGESPFVPSETQSFRR